jgi:hypothetical protein
MKGVLVYQGHTENWDHTFKKYSVCLYTRIRCRGCMFLVMEVMHKVCRKSVQGKNSAGIE